MKSCLFLILCLVTFNSCDPYAQDEYEEYYVIEGYLVADNLLPPVYVSNTGPVEDKYHWGGKSFVNNAQVEVHLLETGSDSKPEDIFEYELYGNGKYESKTSHKVIPTRTYALRVTFPESDEKITAHTIVPDTFKVVEGVQDSVTYKSSNQLDITVTESFYPGRQNIFLFNAVSLTPEEDKLTPEYLERFEDGGRNPKELNVFANLSSDIINEGNFRENSNNTFTIKYPWNGFSFFEENLLIANTIDDNVYDFIRSQDVQLGGSTLSPGEIQNVIYNIEGGIGVFGAIASDTVAVFLKRP